MMDYLRDELQFLVVVAMWVLVGIFLGPVAFAFIPLTLLAFKSRDMWSEMLMGMLLILVLSDVNKEMVSMRIFKDVKEVYVVVLAMFLVLEQKRFAPFPGVFTLFLPFFVYSLFPLIWSNNFLIGLQKTISYGLMFMLVPSYLLYNYRRQGWTFLRNLMFFVITILLSGFIMAVLYPPGAYVGGRFTGIFGNPNGLGIFSYLTMVLFGVMLGVKQDLFSWREKLFVYAVVLYFLIQSGSRASLTAVLIFVLFNRFFSYSPVLGLFVLLAFVAVIEAVSSNLNAIVLALGLEEYLRLRTLEDGSGRYFAWNFAWEKIQEYLVFGGGFANDEYVMRRNYAYLERMGHQGGVHNSYLSMWFNVGAVGLALYFRSFVLLFIKASKLLPMSTAIMFSVLFSIMYESWLVGSLNPYTIMLLMIMTIASEEEIVNWREYGPEGVREEEEGAIGEDGAGDVPETGTQRVPVF
jgi:O-antigen ligase